MGKFKNNLIIAFIAQSVSILTSVFISLLLPKVMGMDNYAYYQLLIFGISYVGIFHFGLSDGVYLKYGGKNYDELDWNKLSVFFWIMLAWLLLISILGFIVLGAFVDDATRRFVWNVVLIYGVLANESWYLGFVFQATNNTKWYSTSILIFKTFILFVYSGFIFLGINDVRNYVVVYVISQLISFLYCVKKGAKIVFGLNNFTWNWLVELLDTCKIGINLTISNISNTLILGFGRIIVDKKWKLVTFGKISLAISLTNFLMQFMQQISMVLFPALRQSTKDFQKDLYDVLFDTIGIVLCGSYILYFPLEMALSKWLPQYSDSFVYLGVLLPICCYDGKVYVLYNTYMKVLRKEKYILKINVLSCILSFVLSVTFSSVFNSIIPVILAIVLTICFRNFAFGYILTANKNRYYLIFGMETMLSLVFELLCFCTTKPVAVITYSFIYCIVILIHRNSFLQLKSFLGHEK